MRNSNSTDKAPPRTILLLGSPRSGTSWLAKILDTYENVFYAHEPLQKRRDDSLQLLVRQLLTAGELAPHERCELLARLRELDSDSLLLPFFRKTFLRRAPQTLTLLWLLRRMCPWSDPWFRAWCGVKPDAAFDLLIKEVDFLAHAEKLVRGLGPDRLLILMRHPCGVVSSRVRGVRMGVIHEHDRTDWLARNGAACHELGYSTCAVEKMSLWEFYALDWLLQNRVYVTLARHHACTTTVLYRDLCGDPLAVAQKLFAFLGWPLGDATKRFIQDSTHTSMRQSFLNRLWNRRSYYDLHKDPQQTAMAWKHLLTVEQQKAILAIARHLEQFEALFGE